MRSGEDAIGLFVKKCRGLERLVLDGLIMTSDVEIVSSTLKHLDLCSRESENSVKVVSAPNLTCLMVDHGSKRVFLKNVPKLVNMNFVCRSGDSMHHFAALAHNLETLIITLYHPTAWISVPDMPRLKKLVLYYREVEENVVLPMTCFIRASPCLEEFKLEVGELAIDGDIVFEIPKDDVFRHEHLKRFVLSGFCGGARDHVALVRYIVNSCVALQEIVVGQTNTGPPVSSAEREMGGDIEKLGEIELSAIKQQYLGSSKPNPKKRKLTEDTLDWSQKMLDEMTERDWRMLMLEFNISYIEGSRIPPPMRRWEESRLHPELIKAVDRAGYEAPTPIQMAAIPLALQQRDIVGVVETGSGTTAVFVLPMLTHISRLPPINELNKSEGPYAVVIAPSIKLVQKVEDETVKFAHYLGIKVVSIVGFMSEEEKKFKFGMGCEVVITSPITLSQCLYEGYAVLNQCNYVVFYYADRLVCSITEPRLVSILDAMPSSNMKPDNEDEELDDKKIYRTTCMFGATMPSALMQLATKYLRNPVVVNIGIAEKATKLITQHVIMTKESDKMDWLRRFLDELGVGDKTAFIFVNTSEVADNVAKNLNKDGYRVARLREGKKSQVFRTNRYNVFVATDVAGRGVDIPDVACVINYDMSGNIEAYARRIGRTGSAGRTGIAITFLTMHDINIFYDLKQMLISSNSIVPSELARHEASKFRPPWRNATAFAH